MINSSFAEVRSSVDEGLAVQIGLSEVSVAEIQAALDFGLPVASVQNRYNTSCWRSRRAERDC